MSHKTLLVHLNTSRRVKAPLKVALSLACRVGAHLASLFPTFVPEPCLVPLVSSYRKIPIHPVAANTDKKAVL